MSHDDNHWLDRMQSDLDAAVREAEDLRGLADRMMSERDDVAGRLSEANAEIARLRAEKAAWRRDVIAISAVQIAGDAEIARLRAENEGLTLRVGFLSDSVYRLRAMLKGALVPCPECGGHEVVCRNGEPVPCERCTAEPDSECPFPSKVPGYVPVEVEP